LGREAFQEMDVVRAFEPIVKWAVELKDAAGAGQLIERAVATADTRSPGDRSCFRFRPTSWMHTCLVVAAKQHPANSIRSITRSPTQRSCARSCICSPTPTGR